MHNCKACKARITLGIYCEVCERQVGLLADIDALTAERDELKRRLDAVVAMLEEDAGNEPVSYTYPEDPSLLRWQTVSELHARALAIAEGRTP